MKPRRRSPQRLALIATSLVGTIIFFRIIVAGPPPAQAHAGQNGAPALVNPFTQPPFSNFGQNSGGSGQSSAGFGAPQMRTTVS